MYEITAWLKRDFRGGSVGDVHDLIISSKMLSYYNEDIASLILRRSRSFAAFFTRSLPSPTKKERAREKSRERTGPSENQAKI